MGQDNWSLITMCTVGGLHTSKEHEIRHPLATPPPPKSMPSSDPAPAPTPARAAEDASAVIAAALDVVRDGADVAAAVELFVVWRVTIAAEWRDKRCAGRGGRPAAGGRPRWAGCGGKSGVRGRAASRACWDKQRVERGEGTSG